MAECLERANDYIYRNGRLLERVHFAFLFENGSAAHVVDALRPYQNSDGGFGNALEPDMRAPSSQPMHVDMALRILDDVGAFNDSLVGRSVDWLQSIAVPDGGLPWVLFSVQDYPHAPWWIVDAGSGSLGATSSILHLLLKNSIDHAMIASALSFVRKRCADPQDGDLEYHTLRSAGEALNLANGPQDEGLIEKLFEHVKEHDLVAPTKKASDEPYAHTPLHWAREPGSVWRAMFKDEDIERDLDALATRQEDDGSWPLGFPLTTPAAEYEWRARVTIDALNTLRAYGRLS
jgi:hypothetical protein